ncbi:MAG: hypothetical protein FJ034_04560, partial [Chloroflexi bacterium]|nr:hypothetical protein [Chloroflexota bacterium]
MLHIESTGAIQIDLACPDGKLGGWERALAEARDEVAPALAARTLASFEAALIERGCGPRRRPTAGTAP